MVVQVLLHRRLGNVKTLIAQPIGVPATAAGGLEHGEGQQAFERVGVVEGIRGNGRSLGIISSSP